MADASAAMLEALFGSGINAADDGGINAFRKTVGANDYWRAAAAPILSAKFDNSTWSPGQTLGVSAGQAFLGGILNALGQRDEARQLESVASVLPKLYSDPNSVSVPEGVDPEAFGQLKLNALATRAKSEAGSNAGLFKELFGTRIAGMTAAEQEKGKISGRKEAYGNDFDPEDPKEKKLTELRDSFEKKEEVQNFKYVQRLSNQLVSTLKNPSAVADPILAKMVVQFVEPKLAVNAGEAAGLAATSSIPEAWKGMIGQALEGKSKLSPEIRKGLLDIASAAYDAHGKAYNQTFDLYRKEANMFGIPEGRLSSVGEPISFEAFTGSKKSPSTLSFAPEQMAAMAIEKQALAEQGLSPAQIAAALRAKYSEGSPRG